MAASDGLTGAAGCPEGVVIAGCAGLVPPVGAIPAGSDWEVLGAAVVVDKSCAWSAGAAGGVTCVTVLGFGRNFSSRLLKIAVWRGCYGSGAFCLGVFQKSYG